jgi:hypothetical protein
MTDIPDGAWLCNDPRCSKWHVGSPLFGTEQVLNDKDIEREAIIKLVEMEHQVVQDATYWVYKLGPMAGEDAGKYTVLEEEFDKEEKEWFFDTVEEAVDKYMELVRAWRGGDEPSWNKTGA